MIHYIWLKAFSLIIKFQEALKDLQVHDHACLIYENKREQLAAAIPFMRIGLDRGEQCVYIADDNTAAEIFKAMKDEGIDVETVTKSGALTVVGKKDAYLRGGRFDPDSMIDFLNESTDSAKAAGFPALRVTGEMTWVLGLESGNERLAEYENKLNELFQDSDVLGICQYDIEHLDPEIIHQAIYTHPLVIYKGRVWNNFQYHCSTQSLES
ncbi:hypothetical protein LCGC14_2762760 [marine sediment metagenome]|uniref:MEDS domain-containing protein n=1 Tax=marine sediment metagenome TaxID=412755 RepID=A0A0F9BQ43_9ZZZZ